MNNIILEKNPIATYKDFIATYENVYPDDYCQHLIQEFERISSMGAGSNRKKSDGSRKHEKDDYQLYVNSVAHSFYDFKNLNTERIFYDGLQYCFDHYTEQYSILKTSKLTATHMKLQRTMPGQGYHIWHCEKDRQPYADRVLVYMLYLNSLSTEEGGETEFLYQKSRISPKENMMVVWPAQYTHTHRGNLVLGEKNKYVVTGWFYYE